MSQVHTLIEISGGVLSKELAERYLSLNNMNLQSAVDMYFTNPIPSEDIYSFQNNTSQSHQTVQNGADNLSVRSVMENSEINQSSSYNEDEEFEVEEKNEIDEYSASRTQQNEYSQSQTSRDAFALLIKGSLDRSILESSIRSTKNIYLEEVTSTLQQVVESDSEDLNSDIGEERPDKISTYYSNISGIVDEEKTAQIVQEFQEFLKMQKEKKKYSQQLTKSLLKQTRLVGISPEGTKIEKNINKRSIQEILEEVEKLRNFSNSIKGDQRIYIGEVKDRIKLTIKSRDGYSAGTVFSMQFKKNTPPKSEQEIPSRYRPRQEKWKEFIINVHDPNDQIVSKLNLAEHIYKIGASYLIRNNYIMANVVLLDEIPADYFGDSNIEVNVRIDLYLIRSTFARGIIGEDDNSLSSSFMETRNSLNSLFCTIGLRMIKDTSYEFFGVLGKRKADIVNYGYETALSYSGYSRGFPEDNTGKGDIAALSDSINKNFASVYTIDNIVPPPTFKATLFNYQKEALGWMYKRETDYNSLVYYDAGERNLPSTYAEFSFDLKDRRNSHILEAFINKQLILDTDGEGASIFIDPYTGHLTLQRPKGSIDVKGGIVADEMGLGKTVMMISLMHSHRLEQSYLSRVGDLIEEDNPDTMTMQFKEISTPKRSSYELSLSHKRAKVSATKKGKRRLDEIANTLIIAPTSLIAQWEDEIMKFSEPGSMTVYKYYGAQTSNSIEVYKKIRSSTVVLTTFGKICSDIVGGKKRAIKDILLQFYWFRIIIDEAHEMRNVKSSRANAIHSLRGEYKWCLTGTPIQNSLDDLYSLFKFLQYKPWCDAQFWNRNTKKKSKEAEVYKAVFSDIGQILKPILLRRTKEQHFDVLGLEKKNEKYVYFDLEEQDMKIYVSIFEQTKKSIKEMIKTGVLNNNLLKSMTLLMNLRRLCDHRSLCKTEDRVLNPENVRRLLEEVKLKLSQRIKNSNKEKDLKEQKMKDMNQRLPDNPHRHKFSEAKFNEAVDSIIQGLDIPCTICLEQVDEPLITLCMHIFCIDCITEWMKKNNSCPICREPLRLDMDLFYLPISKGLDIEEEVFQQPEEPQYKSSRIVAIMHELDKTLERGERTVIFMHFLQMIRIVSNELKSRAISHEIIQGDVEQKKRARIVKKFLEKDGSKVLLISIKSGGVGLNLVSANNVFIVEPWWNVAVEDQAIDRVHRIGQQQQVNVVKFIAKGTIEEKIKQIQDSKSEMVRKIVKPTNAEIISNLKSLFAD